ncbi:hypothetical protein PoB_001721600 [Plakobranchus ocellatus]|uniref:Uncharacterized protein n=1 Tax=Plakobranchus ocellatus TaxID=259542 RepID=A0AAV3YUF3_9GAST|nr:hypothetical protein PoB_001721600 [Plakobranchus ocellatus]
MSRPCMHDHVLIIKNNFFRDSAIRTRNHVSFPPIGYKFKQDSREIGAIFGPRHKRITVIDFGARYTLACDREPRQGQTNKLSLRDEILCQGSEWDIFAAAKVLSREDGLLVSPESKRLATIVSF